MPTYLVKFSGQASVEAATPEEAIQGFQLFSTPKEASCIKDNNLYNVSALRLLNTRYAGPLETNETVALCYKQIPIFHVLQNYDYGPEFSYPTRHRFSWQRHDIDLRHNQGAQFDAFNEKPPEGYQPDPNELYLGNDLSDKDPCITRICWKIEQALENPETPHPCRETL